MYAGQIRSKRAEELSNTSKVLRIQLRQASFRGILFLFLFLRRVETSIHDD